MRKSLFVPLQESCNVVHHMLAAGVLAEAGELNPTCVQSHELLQQYSRKEVELEMHADAPAGPQPAGSCVCSAAQLLHESCGRQQQWESAQGLGKLEAGQLPGLAELQ